jgi:hypothetical protein
MGMFGPSKDEVWKRLAEELDAHFIDGGFWKGSSKVQAQFGPWIVTLDTYTVHTGHAHFTYTRMRAPYVNPEGLRFTVYRKGLFSELGKLLGMQYIEVGDPEFDEAFIVKGTDEAKVRELMADPEIRSLMLAQPQIRLEVKDGEGWFGPSFPEDVDELHFQVTGVIKEADRLKALFDLFAAVLDRLCRIGSAAEREPGVAL